jgi:DNA-binding GntR family transcriptional regulator
MGAAIVMARSMREQIRDWMLQQIGAGEFAPGERLTETGIAEQLGVSAIPVREAIRELVTAGIMESAAHKGAWVRKVAVSETVEALRVRAAIEPLALRLAAPRLSRRHDQLRRTARGLLAAARRGDFQAFQKLNHAFHRGIVEASGSSVLLRVWDSLSYEVNARSVLDSIPSLSVVDVAWQHGEVLDALEQGATQRAQRLLARHTESLAVHLEKELRNEQAATSRPARKRSSKQRKVQHATS